MRRIALASFVAGLLALTGCVHVHEHDHHHKSKGGPPPWAPAHGYRHKHHGPDLVFDSHIGVYVVVGHPHVYFHDGHYFRYVSSHWERCGDWKKGNWKAVEVGRVPGPLVKHYAAKGPKGGKGKGKGKGKGGPAKHWD
jgi:hypothetical protein